MASTYVNDLRLNEMATGDGSGTWGTTTNTNLELIAEAFSYGTEAITTNADTHTTTIADGATDPGRALYLKYTGTLDSACTITIGPNTVSKVWIIENGTSGSQNIIISQGSGADITIPAGDTKVVYSDGAGAGAAFFDAFASLSVVDLKVQDDLTVTDDASIGGDATITGTLGVTGVFTGTSLDISGDIDVDGTTNLDVVDIDGAVDMASTLAVAGVLTGASLDISGDIDVDGTTNLDVVDIDGAVDMASTLQVTGAANFSDRIGSTYVYPTDATSQTGGVTNHFWKMGRMTLSGPAAAEIELHGLTGYAQNEQIAGKNIIQLRGSNSATVLDGTFHATGDPGVGIQEMRYVPIGDYVFDLYVKLGPFSSLSTTVTCGGTWAPEWTNTGSGSNPASSVDMPAHYALLLGNNIAMYADLSEVVFNDDSNEIDFRVESDGNANMLFVDGGANAVGIGTGAPLSLLQLAKATIPSSITRASNYLQIGGSEEGLNGYQVIGFGYNDSGRTYMPAYIGFKQTVASSGNAGDLIFGTRADGSDAVPTERARLTKDGNLLVGTTSGSTHIIKRAVSVGSLVLEIIGNNLGTRFFNADGGSPNAGNSAQHVYSVGATGRSINAAGTVNASGADYAEYMKKSDSCGTIAKGDVCGVDSTGKLTDVFENAISFVIKSTNPSYVGGDAWGGTELELTEEQYETERQKYDRIAFSGQVPVNITGSFNVGDYVYPQVNGTAIECVAKSSPTFEEYQLCVGKIWATQDDGRPFVAVKIG
jgi:hypothetical protein